MKLHRDILAGVAIAVVGIVFLISAQRLRIGTVMNMGPGYFPSIIAWAVIGAGALVTLEGVRNALPLQRPHIRPLVAILAGIAIFGLLLGSFGLIPAVVGGVLAASAGDATTRPWQAVAVAIGAGIGAWLLFRVGLGLQMPGLRLPGWL